MNLRDERLYHYEYRRPRLTNRTYISSNVQDSLSIFVGGGRYLSPHARAHGDKYVPNNMEETHSKELKEPDVANSRYYERSDQSTVIKPRASSQLKDIFLSDKDFQYLQLLEEKNNRKRYSRTIDQDNHPSYNAMSHSQMLEDNAMRSKGDLYHSNLYPNAKQ